MRTITPKEYDENLNLYGKDTLLHFHVGIGGMSFKPYHITFQGVVDGIKDTPHFDELFDQIDEEGNEMPGEWEYKDECGNGVGLTNIEANAGVGRIIFERGYNEDYVIKLCNCGKEEISSILEFISCDSVLIIPTLIEMEMIDKNFKEEFIEKEE